MQANEFRKGRRGLLPSPGLGGSVRRFTEKPGGGDGKNTEHPHVCGKCGWDFKARNTSHNENRDSDRIDARTQINIRCDADDKGHGVMNENAIIRCSKCYDQELYASGKGHMCDVFGRTNDISKEGQERVAVLKHLAKMAEENPPPEVPMPKPRK